MDSAVISLLGAFTLSILGLFAFIWSLRQGLLVENPRGASVIFAQGEIGQVDDPALTASDQARLQASAAPTDGHAASHTMRSMDAREMQDRVDSDQSSAFPVFMFIMFACFWLVLGSAAGWVASVKLHEPDWLTQYAWLSFGRIRTLHLNAVIYGWSSNACLAVIVWVLPRLLRTRLVGAPWVMLGAPCSMPASAQAWAPSPWAGATAWSF